MILNHLHLLRLSYMKLININLKHYRLRFKHYKLRHLLMIFHVQSRNHKEKILKHSRVVVPRIRTYFNDRTRFYFLDN